jgi:uncharacterized membrane protein YphA (DoxX/SURF4 family)
LSSFPSGLSGYGLLLMRVALAVVAVRTGIERLVFASQTPPGLFVAVFAISGAMWIVGSVSMATGLLTKRIVPVVVFVEFCMILARLAETDFARDLLPGPTDHLFDAAIATALALIGPGAYSLDARIYGRSEIVIRPSASTHSDQAGPID